MGGTAKAVGVFTHKNLERLQVSAAADGTR